MATKDLELANSKDQVRHLKKEVKGKSQDNTDELEALLREKERADELNGKIMGQVSIMKEAIKDSRDTEMRNK